MISEIPSFWGDLHSQLTSSNTELQLLIIGAEYIYILGDNTTQQQGMKGSIVIQTLVEDSLRLSRADQIFAEYVNR